MLFYDLLNICYCLMLRFLCSSLRLVIRCVVVMWCRFVFDVFVCGVLCL